MGQSKPLVVRSQTVHVRSPYTITGSWLPDSQTSDRVQVVAGVGQEIGVSDGRNGGAQTGTRNNEVVARVGVQQVLRGGNDLVAASLVNA